MKPPDLVGWLSCDLVPWERPDCSREENDKEPMAPYTWKRRVFLYCLLFSRESRTTSSLLETIQKRRKTFPCVQGLTPDTI